MAKLKSVRPAKVDSALRKRAEAVLEQSGPEVDHLHAARTPELIHELRVHQAELELQNEELRRVERDLQISKAALELSLNRYRDLYDFAPIARVTLRADGAILEANLAAAALLGVPQERLRQRSLVSFIASSDRPAFERYRSAAFDISRRQRCEVDLRARDGVTRRIWIDGTSDPHVQPVSAGVLLSLIDVTELRNAEAKLHVTNATTRAILDVCLDGITTIDEQGSINSVNPAIEKLFGYSSEESIGQDVSMLMPSPHREEHATYLARYRRTGEKRIIGVGRELRGRRKDGTEFPLRLGVTEVALAGRRLFVGFLHDLTGEKELEKQLRAMEVEAMLAESRERKRVADDLHDGIGQLLALARMKLGMLRSNPKLSEIEAKVRAIEDLIVEAHGQVGTLTFQLSPPMLDQTDLKADMQWLIEDISRRFGLAVELDDDGAPKPLAEAPRMTLVRCVRELLVNVAKHAGIESARMRIWRERDRVHVVVEDEGLGFDSSAKSTGFGLFSTRQRMLHVDGTVQIESVLGDGTRVHLTVPVATQKTRQKEGAR